MKRFLVRPTLSLVAAAAALFGFGVATVLSQSPTITFDDLQVGRPPQGFTFALTGQGKPGVWMVERDDSQHRNVLVQTDADRTDYRFPVAIYDRLTGADVTLSVKFKAISGKGDQGAGLVWRFRDANNYYITRCNALEDNCTIYHVINGRRQAFQNHHIKVASNVWHTLSVNASGNHFVVTYRGLQSALREPSCRDNESPSRSRAAYLQLGHRARVANSDTVPSSWCANCREERTTA